MIKQMLKRIFAIVGSSLALVAAILYLIAGIYAVISIDGDVKLNFFLFISFLLLFGLAFGMIFFGATVLFSFLNNENDDESFNALVLCFTAFQFAYNLFSVCFWGGESANWVILIFSFGASFMLGIHVLGIKTAWYTDTIGVAIGMITAMTVAVANTGLFLAASIIVAVICFAIMSIFALCLIKDRKTESNEKDKDKSVLPF